jgi:hypothetical protein
MHAPKNPAAQTASTLKTIKRKTVSSLLSLVKTHAARKEHERSNKTANTAI